MIVTFNNGPMSPTHPPQDVPFPANCGACGGTQGDDSVRCACGSLLARYTEAGVQLKCRRCKRTVVLPVAGLTSGGATSF
jgi:hypothetical protein